jgi:hypothetical protein
VILPLVQLTEANGSVPTRAPKLIDSTHEHGLLRNVEHLVQLAPFVASYNSAQPCVLVVGAAVASTRDAANRIASPHANVLKVLGIV